jgi:hypothetical protein
LNQKIGVSATKQATARGEGNFVGLLDANSIALLIEHLVQTRGLEPARYIRPALPEYTTA